MSIILLRRESEGQKENYGSASYLDVKQTASPHTEKHLPPVPLFCFPTPHPICCHLLEVPHLGAFYTFFATIISNCQGCIAHSLSPPFSPAFPSFPHVPPFPQRQIPLRRLHTQRTREGQSSTSSVGRWTFQSMQLHYSQKERTPMEISSPPYEMEGERMFGRGPGIHAIVSLNP